MRDFELQMRLRNNRIKARRLELGLTPMQLSERCGVGYATVLEYESMRLSPSTRAGKPDPWRPSARKLAAFFGCSCDELWPEAILAVRKPVVSVEIDAPELAMLAGFEEDRLALPNQEQALETRRLVERVTDLITMLPEREADILRRRFELGDRDQETFNDIGASWGISVERTRQLERRALGRIRRVLQDADDSEVKP